MFRKRYVLGASEFFRAGTLIVIIAGSQLALVGCSTGMSPAKAAAARQLSESTHASTPLGTPISTLFPRPVGLQPPISPFPPLGPLPDPTPAPVSPPESQAIQSVTNFGDSITCGYGATPLDGSGNVHSLEGYAGLLDKQIGVTSSNLCHGGDQAADMTREWVYPNTMPALGQGQLYTVMVGVNDASDCGPEAGCVSDWAQTLSASLAWLALPAEDKVFGTSMTASGGGWIPDPDIGIGKATTTEGATLNFQVQQVVAGRSLYVAYRVFAPWRVNPGTASLSVDGKAVATMSSLPDTGLWIATFSGTTDTIFLVSVPLGDVGQHSVSVAATSPDGAFFSVIWAGASSANYAQVAGAPRVILGQIADTNDSSWSSWVVPYNQALTPLVQSFVANGLNIVVAPTAAALTVPTDFSDTVHPNNSGHAKLTAVFAGVL